MNRFSSPNKGRDATNGLWPFARSILLAILTYGWMQTAQAQSPTPDSFNPVADLTVYSLVLQADGKILASGDFTMLGQQTRNRIARLNADGTLDTAFNPAANGSVRVLAVQGDGGILLGGAFRTLNVQARTNIARLNADGTLDPTFNPGANIDVYSLAVQPNGKVLVGGTFTTLGGQTRNRVGRVNADGTLDDSFNPDADGALFSLAVQADGKIVVGGTFTTVGGQPRDRIARLGAGGTLDSSFNTGANDGVYSLTIQTDGKILVGGSFTTLGGQQRNRIARLNEAGALDPSFNPDANGYVYSLAVQADGKILVGGNFTMLGGQPRNRVGRLNPDGTLDSTFNPSADSVVRSLAIQADGRILVGGGFTILGGQPRNRIARLNNTGPASDIVSYDGSTITWLRGGTAPEVWRTTFEHTSNGTAWSILGAGVRLPGGWQLGGVSVPLGTIRARGFTQGGIVDTFLGAPLIENQPVNRTNIAGTTGTFNARAVGSQPLSYRWRKDGVNLADGANINGSTTATLAVGSVLSSDAHGYDLIVSNAFGSVTSVVASLTVNCLLNTLSTGSGSINRDPDLQEYPADSLVTLSAIPQAAFGFVHWSGDATGSTNPLTVSINTNKNITAIFAPVTVAVASNGVGTVAKSPDKPIYSVGEQVSLVASAGRWYLFSRWSDGNTNNPRVITIDESNTGSYTAQFLPSLPLETVSIGGVTRLAPVGMPAVLVDGVFTLAESVSARGIAWITLTSTFPHCTLLYTVNGADPSLAGTLYAGPFTVEKSCVLRSIAYNAHFAQSVQSDPLSVIILPTLTATTEGGGSVTIDPVAGAYFSNSLASVTATAAPGWSFLHWLGDATGTNPVLSLSMTRDKQVRAVFGTSLNTAVVGGGSIVVDPLSSSYPFASRVRLTAVPANGNTLAFWANAASGMTNNPLTFTVTTTNPTVTAVFTSLGGAQTNSLTVIPNGAGQVTLTPPGNRFPRNTNVVLRAVPDAGQDFLGWSGATISTENPVVVTMLSNTVLTANFTARPQLQGEGQRELLNQEGFRLTLTGEWGVAYRIDRSTNLTEWTPLATLTNVFGTVQFTDGAATNLPQRFYRAVRP